MVLGGSSAMADRFYCDRCGEIWHEDNIDLCAKCGRLVCPNCAGITSPKQEWVCDACQKPKPGPRKRRAA
jgi:hypothetical protein